MSTLSQNINISLSPKPTSTFDAKTPTLTEEKTYWTLMPPTRKGAWQASTNITSPELQELYNDMAIVEKNYLKKGDYEYWKLNGRDLGIGRRKLTTTAQEREYLRKIEQEHFKQEILGHAEATFTTMHQRFLRQIWGDNNYTCKLKREVQKYKNFAEGRYEFLLPTRDSADQNLEYMHISIKVLEQNSNETKQQIAANLITPTINPLGVINSQLIILIAPHVDHWTPGGVRGFKHRHGHTVRSFTAVITNKSPEKAWRQVTDLIKNFFEKRLEGLMQKLGFEDWVWKWIIGKRQKDNLSSNMILQSYSYSLRQSFLTFKHVIEQLSDIYTDVSHEIKIQDKAIEHSTQDLRSELDIIQKALQYKVKKEAENEVNAIKFKHELLAKYHG